MYFLIKLLDHVTNKIRFYTLPDLQTSHRLYPCGDYWDVRERKKLETEVVASYIHPFQTHRLCLYRQTIFDL
jgi:hypothetical protein